MELRLHNDETTPQGCPRNPQDTRSCKGRCLVGAPDAITIVEGIDIASMDAVIDKIAEFSDVFCTESKVARWIDQSCREICSYILRACNPNQVEGAIKSDRLIQFDNAWAVRKSVAYFQI